MKIFRGKFIIMVLLAVASVVGLMTIIRAATTVNLGTADSFAVLAGSGITNTGSTTITGDIGSFPTVTITGGPTVIGTNHAGDGVTQGAKTDLTTAYGDAAGEVCTTDLSGQDLGGMVLTPGVYCFSSSAQLTGTLTLNAQGDADAVFIFKIGSTLTTASNGIVTISNSGQACNVFWQVGSSATLGTNTVFRGNILALTSATLTTGASVDGRVLAQNGAVTLDTNIITKATCAPSTATLTVTKFVNNNYGGTKVVADFPLFVDGSSVTSGVATTTLSGSHTISETTDPGYTSVIGGDCSSTGTINIAPGGTAACTITNSDIAPQLTVTKFVVGGTKIPADFPLLIDGYSVTSGIASTTLSGLHTISETSDPNYTAVIAGDCSATGTINLALGDVKVCTITNSYIVPPSSGGSGYSYIAPIPPIIEVVKVPSPLALPGGAGPVVYTYTLHNIGIVPVVNITMIDDSCSSTSYISGDTNNDSKLDLKETWIYKCSTTLLKTQTNIVVATGWANGLNTTDIANATVMVGAPIIPPLIHVTKVPSPLTLTSDGGMITYTEKITNPGVVALSNVQLTDDKCSPVNYISGDTNGDSKLDTSETWTYTCRANITQTTTNTATASGWANGLIARDFAFATVVVDHTLGVTIPGLPNTGSAPGEDSYLWHIIVSISTVILIFTSIVLVSRNKIF